MTTIDTPVSYPSKAAQMRDYQRIVDMWEPIYRAVLDDIMYSAPRDDREARAAYIRRRTIPRDFADLRREHLPALGTHARKVEELKAIADRIVQAPIAKPEPEPYPVTPFTVALSDHVTVLRQVCSDEFTRLCEKMYAKLAEHEGRLDDIAPRDPSLGLDPFSKRALTHKRNQYLAITMRVGEDRYVPCAESMEARRQEHLEEESSAWEAFLHHLWNGAKKGRHGEPATVYPLSMGDPMNMVIEVEYPNLYVERWVLSRVGVVLPSMKLVSKYSSRKVRYAVP